MKVSEFPDQADLDNLKRENEELKAEIEEEAQPTGSGRHQRPQGDTGVDPIDEEGTDSGSIRTVATAITLLATMLVF